MKIARVIVLCIMVLMPAMAAKDISAAEDQSGVSTAELRLLLNSFVALGEGHVKYVSSGLKLISVTSEAQSGKWEDMKPLLAEFGRSGVKAAALWFVRPDGSYYTVEKNLTELNLQDRPYFPRLMAGEEVMGELVISKSTRKRTAIVAVPVKRNGRIIGALGASLSVEEISKMLDEKMGLPENLVFYAIDSTGRTSLHRVSKLLFAYPSDMGSETLQSSVEEMLSKPEGVAKYYFRGDRTVVFRKSLLTGWVYALGFVTGKPSEAAIEPSVPEPKKEINAVPKGAADALKSPSGEE